MFCFPDGHRSLTYIIIKKTETFLSFESDFGHEILTYSGMRMRSVVRRPVDYEESISYFQIGERTCLSSTNFCLAWIFCSEVSPGI